MKGLPALILPTTRRGNFSKVSAFRPRTSLVHLTVTEYTSHVVTMTMLYYARLGFSERRNNRLKRPPSPPLATPSFVDKTPRSLGSFPVRLLFT